MKRYQCCSQFVVLINKVFCKSIHMVHGVLGFWGFGVVVVSEVLKSIFSGLKYV